MAVSALPYSRTRCTLRAGSRKPPFSAGLTDRAHPDFRMHFDQIFVSAEAVHMSAHCSPMTAPLTGCSRASASTIVSGTQIARCCQSGERAGRFDAHECADDDVADDDHHQIGRQIVGAMMVQLPRRNARTDRPSSEYEAKSLPSPQCGQRPRRPRSIAVHKRARRSLRYAARPPKTCSVHHRLLPRGAADAVGTARARDLGLLALWNDRLEPGRAFGSLSISKRIAPASGATSIRRTSTRSAS